MTSAPTLLFAWGNPSRGDDALGPELLERIEAALPAHPEWGALSLLCDFQLQPEHALDLEGRARVLFIDASVSCRRPFEFVRLSAAQDASYTTHAMSPSALLQAFRQIEGVEAPPAYLLRLRGMSFELGDALGDCARDNLDAAFDFVAAWLAGGWRQFD